MSKVILLLLPLALLSSCSEESRSEVRAGESASAPKPDNTAINARDKPGDTLTPLDQKENEADLALTQKIRQALIAEPTLSLMAQNVKIISQHGSVTLRGPVQTQSEKDTISIKAKAVPGVVRVDNQLEVKGP